MPGTEHGERAVWVGGLGGVAVLAAGGAILARSVSAASVGGVALVSAGVVAVLLLGFPVREIVRAIVAAAAPSTANGEERRRAALVWEAAARNAWVLSATTAVAGLVSVLCSDFGTISRFVSGVGDRATGVALGALLAVVFAIPATRILPSAGVPAE